MASSLPSLCLCALLSLALLPAPGAALVTLKVTPDVLQLNQPVQFNCSWNNNIEVVRASIEMNTWSGNLLNSIANYFPGAEPQFQPGSAADLAWRVLVPADLSTFSFTATPMSDSARAQYYCVLVFSDQSTDVSRPWPGVRPHVPTPKPSSALGVTASLCLVVLLALVGALMSSLAL